jgi:ABC-2 type transport system permease protein
MMPATTTTAPPRLIWFTRVLLAFLRREVLEASRYRAAFVTRVAGVAFGAFSLLFFSRFIGTGQNQHLEAYGGNYLAFGLCGLVAAELQQIGIASLANRVRMAQLMGYLEAQLGTPAPVWIVLGAHPVYELSVAVGRGVLYMLGAALVLGVEFHPNAATLLLGIPLTLAAFGGLGLVSAATTMVTRRTNPIAVVLAGASALLSGVVYPVSVLPGWLIDVGRLLPLTHALEVLRRGLLLGQGPEALAPSLGALAIFAVVFSGLGLVAFAWALGRARDDGSLSHF